MPPVYLNLEDDQNINELNFSDDGFCISYVKEYMYKYIKTRGYNL